MASKFRRGALAYSKDGHEYVVESVEDGIVYCSGENGAEAEFPESALMTDTEWGGRKTGRADLAYSRLRQSPAFSKLPAKLDRAAAEQTLSKVERLAPGILDFAAFTTATRILADAGEQGLVPGLSIPKCRAVFDEAKPEIRAGLLAGLLGAAPDVLVSAGRLGDNLMRAMIDKGMADHAADFDSFRDRRRR